MLKKWKNKSFAARNRKRKNRILDKWIRIYFRLYARTNINRDEKDIWWTRTIEDIN
jgi:hypothetical protein